MLVYAFKVDDPQVDTNPTTTTTTIVGDGVYKTKTEAEPAVKTTKVCTEQ
ncbi:hypothetical protein ACVINW_003948 [Bradyrhizobium sp. USDA 4461]